MHVVLSSRLLMLAQAQGTNDISHLQPGMHAGKGYCSHLLLGRGCFSGYQLWQPCCITALGGLFSVCQCARQMDTSVCQCALHYKWNYLAAAPCVLISMSNAYCYQVSSWVATAAHACFVVAQSCALFLLVCSQLWCLFLWLGLKVVVHVPASDQHDQHVVLKSEQGASGDPTCLSFDPACLSFCQCSTSEPCDLKTRINKFHVPLSLLSKRNIMYHVTTSLDWAACHLTFRRWEPEWTLTHVFCVFCVCVYAFMFLSSPFFPLVLCQCMCSFRSCFCNMALLCYDPLLCGHFFLLDSFI